MSESENRIDLYTMESTSENSISSSESQRLTPTRKKKVYKDPITAIVNKPQFKEPLRLRTTVTKFRLIHSTNVLVLFSLLAFFSLSRGWERGEISCYSFE